MEKSKCLHFRKVQGNPEKSRVLALKSNKNSQSYNEITKINDFCPLYPPNLRQSIICFFEPHSLGNNVYLSTILQKNSCGLRVESQLKKISKNTIFAKA